MYATISTWIEKILARSFGAVQTCLLLVALLILPSIGQAADQAPLTLKEGMQRMEKLLGVYDEDDQHEWRVPMSFEIKQRPDPSKPEILIVFQGIKVVGQPFRQPEGLSFDETWQWKRQVFDLKADGSKTLTRSQESHNVTRYTLTITGDKWFVDGTMLSNGVHSSIGRPTFQGGVTWRDDGIEFTGHEGVDRFYAAEGKFVMGAAFGTRQFLREGDQLILKANMQPCQLAEGPQGQPLKFPDLSKPIGTPFILEFKSDQRSTTTETK